MENSQNITVPDIFEQRTIQGVNRLCINTTLSPRQFVHSTLTHLLHEKGYRITVKNNVDAFILNEPIALVHPYTKKEYIYFILPFCDIKPLSNTILPEQYTDNFMVKEEKVHFLLLFFSRLFTISKQPITPEQTIRKALQAGPLCFFSASNGDSIVLPPNLFLCCIQAQNTICQMVWCRPWIHPHHDTAPPYAAELFFLSTLIYTCLSATLPFGTTIPFARSEQLLQNMLDAAFVPIQLFCPCLHNGFAAALNAGLSLNEHSRAQELLHCLYSYKERSIFDHEKIIPDHTEAYRYQYIKQQKRKISIKRFFRRYTKKILTSCLFSIAVIICFALLFQKSTLTTSGLSAHTVVEQFYQAISKLEPETLHTYTQKHLQTEYDQLIIRLFIAGTIREGYEHKKIYYSPEESVQALKKYQNTANSGTNISAQTLRSLLHGGIIYGISHFSLLPIVKTEHNSVFDISFCYWLPFFPQEHIKKRLDMSINNPDASVGVCCSHKVVAVGFNTLYYDAERRGIKPSARINDMNQEFPLQIFFYRDRVQLAHIDNAWYITLLEPLERTALIESSEQFLQNLFLSSEKKPLYLQEPVQFYCITSVAY